MSGQALDLRRSVRLVRRHKILVGVVAVLGFLGGAAYAVHWPPMLTSEALVVIPNANHASAGQKPGASANAGVQAAGTDISTQVVIAGSDPVLAGALPSIRPSMPLQTLRDRVRVTHPSDSILSITAKGQSPAQAVSAANAVAGSYIAYAGSARSAEGKVHAQMLGRATTATGTPLSIRVAEFGGIGLLAGILIGTIIALAIGRRDRRLRDRDQIADSIGVPVLASVSAKHPRDAAGWARLFEGYKPGAVDGWQLRKTLHQLGLAGVNTAGAEGPGGSVADSGSSLAVLSLSSDRRALALGPQLAAFAGSLGIPAALVVGPQQDESAVATLFAACSAAPAPTGPSGNLLVTVSDQDDAGQVPGVALTVIVAVVDGQHPRVASTMRATTTLLGVSPGRATAEQLARVAASAAADGRSIAGILVADPDPADQTTGRMPQVARPGPRRMPTRMTSATTGTRR